MSIQLMLRMLLFVRTIIITAIRRANHGPQFAHFNRIILARWGKNRFCAQNIIIYCAHAPPLAIVSEGHNSFCNHCCFRISRFWIIPQFFLCNNPTVFCGFRPSYLLPIFQVLCPLRFRAFVPWPFLLIFDFGVINCPLLLLCCKFINVAAINFLPP